MLNQVRAPISKALAPLGAGLARAGVSPDVITVVGTIGVAGGALAFYTRGVFFLGSVVITLFVFSDLLDGLVARHRGTESIWGAFLDSSLDRIGDGAIFGSLVIWYAGHGHSVLLAGVALFALIMGSLTSYVKARAQSLGLTCDVGFAERAERLIIIITAAGLYGLGVPYLLPAALWFLAAATFITVLQRLVEVHRQAVAPRPKSHPRGPRRYVRRRVVRSGSRSADRG